MRTAVSLALAAVVALGLGACGQDGPQNDAERAVVEFHTALQGKDWKGVCERIDPGLKDLFDKEAGSCENAMEKSVGDDEQFFRDVSGELEVAGSDIDEDAGTGTVQVKANDGQVHDIGVKKIKGQWRVVGG